MWLTCCVLLPFGDIELQTDPSKFCVPEVFDPEVNLVSCNFIEVILVSCNLYIDDSKFWYTRCFITVNAIV